MLIPYQQWTELNSEPWKLICEHIAVLLNACQTENLIFWSRLKMLPRSDKISTKQNGTPNMESIHVNDIIRDQSNSNISR